MEGFQSVWAKNGQVALDNMLNVSETELPDLVLLDFLMPVMNGQSFIEAKSKIEKLSGIPVVLMTAGGFMSKPMNLVTIVTMIKHFTGQDSHQ